jgi:predicted metal-dependent enzyme (double-stranded beta helix superfamily)
MSTDTTTDLFADVASVDWNNLATVTAASDKLLTALDVHRDALRELTEHAVGNPELLPLCEHYDILNKIVLHDDPTGWRLRLHIFLPGYFDRPHNHRWTYSSRILHGSYTHTLYGTDDQLCASDDIDVTELQPCMVRTESAGDFYTLHHAMIHSVIAEPYTTSLIVRGPAVKDRFLVTDRVTGQAWWQYGAAMESPDTAVRKQMNTSQANACLQELTKRRILT